MGAVLVTQRQLIADNLRKLDQIEQGYQQKKISLVAAQKQIKELRDSQKLLKEKVADLRNVQKQWQDRHALVKDPQLEQEVQTLKRQVDTADKDVQNYVGRLNVSTLG